jgi:UDPglucose 6-dehydrogenase
MIEEMELKKLRVTVVGAGYVGMSLSALLAEFHDVTVVDIDTHKVDMINNNQSTIKDYEIEKLLKNNQLNLHATSSGLETYRNSELVIIATPTNFDENNNKFNTSIVDKVVREILSVNDHTLIVIKSTIPIGHTKHLQQKLKTDRIIFSPEFLREGRALYDNQHPSRIIIGNESKQSKHFADILLHAAKKKSKVLFLSSTAAEAIKLFSNTYLALRIGFFNELDSFAFENNIDTKSIIDGLSLDDRIGDYYNNPSFGYGGYCLPKDSKQLLAQFKDVPQTLIKAAIESNKTRKDFIAHKILDSKATIFGIYRLSIKKDSDNFRSSAVLSIIETLKSHNKEIIIYEPNIIKNEILNAKVENNLDIFKERSEIIISNRIDEHIIDVSEKVFTRDIYQKD